MTRRAWLPASTVVLLGVLGCSPQPTPESLRTSFGEQIAAVQFVHDFTQDGDEVTFARPDGSGEEISWRVRIDSASVEPQDDESLPFRGIILSSWWIDGVLVGRQGEFSDLPMWVLDSGLGQECWAFWETESSSWGW